MRSGAYERRAGYAKILERAYRERRKPGECARERKRERRVREETERRTKERR